MTPAAVDRPALPKEDLFEHSTMTFGEHLEELRRALARAILWLIAGALVALVFAAKPMVRWIQGPLEAAIVVYKVDQGIALFGNEFSNSDERDAERIANLRDFMISEGLKWEKVFTYAGVAAPAVDQSAAGPTDANQPTDANKAAETAKPAKPAKPASGASPADSPQSPQESPQRPTQIPAPSDFAPTWMLVKTEAGLNSHKVEEPFMIYLKASVVVGSVLASPMIFYHIWGFVAAGLYPHERKYVYLYLPFSVILFISGVSIAFFAVLGFVLQFLLDFNSTLSVNIEPRLSYWMNFVLLLPLGFGIAFQLPLVMLFLQRIGIIETVAYEKSWRIAVLVIAVLSMLLTPADPYSMILLMCPLVLLYFLGIGLCRFMPRGRGLGSAAYDAR